MHLETERDKVAHLLRRFGLGASEAEIAYYGQNGLKGAIDRLINYDAVEEAAMPTLEDFTKGDGKLAFFGLTGWYLTRLLTTRRPLQEKMTLFWHNHFATSGEKVKAPPMMAQQNEIFRRNATGNFGQLLSEVSKDPAMILWLDNEYNVAGKPNENFAREVMELFTLGIGHYTEKDIQESARAYTGWSLRRGGGNKTNADGKIVAPMFFFRQGQHDNGEKTFFGQTANFSGDDILATLCKMPRTAEYITTKMWKFFGYRDPEPELIARLSQEFHQSSLDLRTLLRSIMESPEFYSDKAYRSIYKNPVEFCVGSLRVLGVGEEAAGGVGNKKIGALASLGSSLKGMGMQLFFPPDVAGWDQGQAWITTATMVERISFADKIFGKVGGKIVNVEAYGLFQQDPTPLGAARKLASVFDAPIGEEKLQQLAGVAQRVGGDRITQDNANAVAREITRLIFASPEYQFC